MSKAETALRALRRSLGDEYQIRYIDLEKCLYRDFGNGFDVEISGVNTSRTDKPATIYLWYNDSAGGHLIVRTMRDIPRDEIADAVEGLYDCACSLIEEGKNTWSDVMEIKHHPVWNMAKGGTDMKHKIYYGAAPKLSAADKKNFSHGDYECKELMINRRGLPVVISQRKDPDFPIWRVDYDICCTTFFGCYEDAMDFCRGKFTPVD